MHEEVIHILGVHEAEVFPPGPQEFHELTKNTKIVLQGVGRTPSLILEIVPVRSEVLSLLFAAL